MRDSLTSLAMRPPRHVWGQPDSSHHWSTREVDLAVRGVGRIACTGLEKAATGGEAGRHADVLPAALDPGQFGHTPDAGIEDRDHAKREHEVTVDPRGDLGQGGRG